MSCKKKIRLCCGFTLIELAISVMIVSLIISGIISIQNQRIRADRENDMQRKLDEISEALYNYKLVNYKLPCPGDSSLARSNQYFGLEADSEAESCDSGENISSNINTSNGNVFGGSVPVRTLGLRDEYAFDPWGRLFTYYVDKEATNVCNFAGNLGTEGMTDTNNLNVEDESGTTLSEDVLAVVISHGANGHGAYNSAGNRISKGITNTSELENCMCDASAAAASDADLVIRLQRTLPTDATNMSTNFDDVGRYFTKPFFYTYEEKNR